MKNRKEMITKWIIKNKNVINDTQRELSDYISGMILEDYIHICSGFN